MNTVPNALTVDVEDYFQVSAFSDNVDRKDWHQMAPRVEANTRRLLDLFDSKGVKGTFFVLGWVAERFPSIAREIHQRGHEVASHGFSHELIYRQTPQTFRAETERSKKLLEDQLGHAIFGYRAASYSIVESSLWALDIIHELGFSYDSSIFPVRHDRYGLVGGPNTPHELVLPNGGRLQEFPLSQVRFGPLRMPISGGGYFRIYPLPMTLKLLELYRQRNKAPFVFYVHPWELDPEQPRISGSALSRFRHYHNLDRCEKRLATLLDKFSFAAMSDVLNAQLNDGGTLAEHRYPLMRAA